MKSAVSLKNEMKGVSMVDEFAKYAKIQRRLNQVNIDLEATSKSKRQFIFSLDWISSILCL